MKDDEKTYDAKEIAALLDKMPTRDSISELKDKIDSYGSRIAVLEKPPAKTGDVVEDPEAELEARAGTAGFLDGINKIEVWDIPIGQAVVGGFAAIFASELVDGFMADSDAWKRGLVKIIAAGVAAKWGKRVLGSTGSKAVALLLTFDAIRDFTPLDTWADQLAEKISGKITTAGLAGNEPGKTTQPAKTTKDSSYYALAMGGGS